MILYIDPGTGSMLFTVVIALASTLYFFVRKIIIKLKFGIIRNNNSINSQKLPVVIFSDHKRYWSIFEPICDELERRSFKTYYYTMSEDDPAFARNYQYINCLYIGEGNKGFSKLNFLNARIVFSTTPGLEVFQWKKSKLVDCYIHIMHAPKDATMYRMFGIDYYDCFLASGAFQIDQIRELEKIRNLPEKEIEIVGIPYMDVIKKRFDEYRSQVNNNEKTKTVLIAPSWGDSGILSKYGIELISQIKNTGYNIIIRPHPQSLVSERKIIDDLMIAFNDDSQIKWDMSDDNFDSMKSSDIMISDFSGIMLEYNLIFDKPIIYTPFEFDDAQYDCAWLDEEPWIFKILPQIGLELKKEDLDRVKEIIDDCLDNTKYSLGRTKARSEVWMYENRGADRVADYIIKKYEALQESEV